MPLSSLPLVVERARPLLGTYVAIRVRGLDDTRAQRAIDAAFEEIALIHGRMSFHEGDSDVSRLNREARSRAVRVHPRTFDVLHWSRRIAEASRGCFDITVAAELVEWGLLPSPTALRPDPAGSWRDVELRSDGTVYFLRPVWIDLGGIAKGYAVDCAIERLREYGVVQGCVNAGGDLRVLGSAPELVHLRTESRGDRVAPRLEIRDGSLASSSGRRSRRRHLGHFLGPHVHGAHRRAVGTHTFASVVAGRCVVADALTKIVLAQGQRSDALLRHYRATAHVHSARRDWRSFGASV